MYKRQNLIYPHVVGESVGLPSIWVLAAVTVGGNIMGIVGMLVFIPLLSDVYKRQILFTTSCKNAKNSSTTIRRT